MIDYSTAYENARDERPFANGTEGYGWMGAWCDRCLVDAPFRNGIARTGCPLILVAMEGRTPIEWLDQKRTELRDGREMLVPYSIEDQYHCIEFRAPGDGGGGEPRPKPTPRGQLGLFGRDEVAGRRMLVPVDTAPVPDSVGAGR